MTTNDTDEQSPTRSHPKEVVMTARRTNRTAPAVDIAVEDTTPVVEETVTIAAPASTPKYFSHANCTHERKGDAGKQARAKCRKDIRAWLAAAEAFEAENTVTAAAV